MFPPSFSVHPSSVRLFFLGYGHVSSFPSKFLFSSIAHTVWLSPVPKPASFSCCRGVYSSGYCVFLQAVVVCSFSFAFILSARPIFSSSQYPGRGERREGKTYCSTLWVLTSFFEDIGFCRLVLDLQLFENRELSIKLFFRIRPNSIPNLIHGRTVLVATVKIRFIACIHP